MFVNVIQTLIAGSTQALRNALPAGCVSSPDRSGFQCMSMGFMIGKLHSAKSEVVPIQKSAWCLREPTPGKTSFYYE